MEKKNMKIFERLIVVLLPILVVIAGCAAGETGRIKKAVQDELGLLSDLDTDTVAGYIRGTGVLSDVLPAESRSSSEIQDSFVLFYKDFDYKIQSVETDPENNSAKATVRLTTLDANALAKDYEAAILRTEIMHTADTGKTQPLTSAEKYQLLYELLSSNDYPPTKNTVEISLTQKGDTWEIEQTEELKDALSGGLITYLADPDILTPSETLDIYLSSLKDMNTEQMQNYLGVESIVKSEDTQQKKIAEGLIGQVKKHYDYSITDTSWEGAKAIVTADITTFDSQSILSAYQRDMDAYLSSADAVIDGSEKRTAIAQEKLLSYITDNKDTVTSRARFELANDGTAWRLISPGQDLGEALFGSLTSAP